MRKHERGSVSLFSHPIPYLQTERLAGKLIVVEGSDGAGRSTHIASLRQWLELEGYGVVDTGLVRSELVSETVRTAKEGHTMNVLTGNLLYATDLADQLEHVILPALHAGFIVLSDRYVFTPIARARVRSASPAWVRALYSFAVPPQMVLYLKVNAQQLLRRALLGNGIDYWEAGLDVFPALDVIESYGKYQTRLLREYAALAKEFGFITVDAMRSVDCVQNDLRTHIACFLGIRRS